MVQRLVSVYIIITDASLPGHFSLYTPQKLCSALLLVGLNRSNSLKFAKFEHRKPTYIHSNVLNPSYAQLPLILLLNTLEHAVNKHN